MAERKRIGLLFTFDYATATGLAIYMINIVRMLKRLDDGLKPHLVVIYSSTSPIDDLKDVGYEYSEYYLLERTTLKLSVYQRLRNKLSRILGGVYIYNSEPVVSPFPRQIDLIYPYTDLTEAEYISSKIYWKADFQEKYYPDFFTPFELQWSKTFLNNVSKQKNVLVLSSQNAFEDYKKFYPNFRNKVKLLRFASLLPDMSHLVPSEVLAKYSVDKPYFFVANQFWPHKNHIVILKAIKMLMPENMLFVFSGRTVSHRDPTYFAKLQSFIEEQGIGRFVKMIGFIDRVEQLHLMKKSMAIIQPTLFEGWSTVIEDSKALNKFVIASNLAVNIEQIKSNCVFFDPSSPEALAKHIRDVAANRHSVVEKNYDDAILRFERDIISVFEIDE